MAATREIQKNINIMLPIKNIIVGFYLNSAEAQQDSELQDHSFNVTERL